MASRAFEVRETEACLFAACRIYVNSSRAEGCVGVVFRGLGRWLREKPTALRFSDPDLLRPYRVMHIIACRMGRTEFGSLPFQARRRNTQSDGGAHRAGS